MKSISAWSMLVLMSVATISVAETAKVEKVILKEPNYCNRPGYLLLVFGQEMKDRVWVVADGKDRIYIDRNRNGDLTDDGPGMPTPSGWFDLGTFDLGGGRKSAAPRLIITANETKTMFQVKYACEAYVQWVRSSRMGDSSTEAAVVSLDGPLSMGLLNNRRQLKVVEKPGDLDWTREQNVVVSVWVGTPNAGAEVQPTMIHDLCHFLEKKAGNRNFDPKVTLSVPGRPGTNEIALTGD
jgi:hypothetical protein